MPEFDASLIAAGDPKPIATKILINGSDLELRALGDSLGSWPISELDLTRVDGGFRLTVEGEEAFLKIGDSQPMADAVASAANVKTPKKRRSDKGANHGQAGSKANGVKATTSVQEKAAPTAGSPADQNSRNKTRLDTVLDAAESRLGKYLPAWIFTTGGLVVVGVVLILLLVFNNLFSAVLLILGAVGLVASGIALLDDVVAMKIFRGKFTPIQGLIVSLTVGLVGILLGAI
ncbi:MAG TPA: hypothetical protein VIW94_07465 [Acidimicrobiia bacterium]